jgi:hypothetical protein
MIALSQQSANKMEKNSTKNLHDLLYELAQLDKKGIEEKYTEENIRAINDLTEELLGVEYRREFSSPSEFADFVVSLYKFKKGWSHELGRAIISSGELYDNGDKEGAIKLMDNFLQECPSPFFNANAQACRDGYLSEKFERKSDEDRRNAHKAAHALADAIESKNRGDKEKAVAILDELLETCPIESYKEDAQTLKDDIMKSKG